MQHNSFTRYIFLLVLLTGCATHMPRETGVFKPTNLVELVKLDSTLKLDIRYATANNFTKQAVYTQARAFLQRDAAEALVQVNHELREQGYGLLIFDGYRPWRVTKLFWKVTPANKHNFVANPKNGSRHNRGCAVDLSLYDLKTGREIQMTGEYDEMSQRSYINYTGGTEQQRHMRDLLRQHMEAHGFKVLSDEWWHFDYKDWKQYRLNDIPFEKL